ncbi:hypothetical protein [Alteromonas confluentis]|uniref:Uncharacterized protein n=1 Tax=Alteromonas confluentis TaxID=1656094 RepID=A0A1E7ZBE0_9ALTE|nr:hypothetical protein [Alteromonas confluentis]OFC70827.1 hypothetical protein BFC18_10245 [Alteromonas confluentis]
MSKLLKLKKYLPLTDATNYLSTVLEEQVSLADLYELALDGHLAISIRFPEQTFATETNLVSDKDSEARQTKAETVLPTNTEKRIHYISGTYDLAMLGLEKYEIRKLHQRETDGPVPTLAEMNGYFIKDEGNVYQLLDSLPVSKSEEMQNAVETELEALLISKGTSVQSLLDNPSAIFEQFDSEEIEQVMGLLNPFEVEQDGTYLLSLEDTNHQFVVRREELDRFVTELEKPSQSGESGDTKLYPIEKRTHLNMIRVLLNELKIDPAQRGVSSSILHMYQLMGVDITDNTIRKVLKEIVDISA